MHGLSFYAHLIRYFNAVLCNIIHKVFPCSDDYSCTDDCMNVTFLRSHENEDDCKNY